MSAYVCNMYLCTIIVFKYFQNDAICPSLCIYDIMLRYLSLYTEERIIGHAIFWSHMF